MAVDLKKRVKATYTDSLGVSESAEYTLSELKANFNTEFMVHAAELDDEVADIKTKAGLQEANVVEAAAATASLVSGEDTLITFTAATKGEAMNGVKVDISCRLSATIGNPGASLVVTGDDGLHPESKLPLKTIQIVQSEVEAPLSFGDTDGVLTVVLPADENGDPIYIHAKELYEFLRDEIGDVIASVDYGDGWTDGTFVEEDEDAVPFTSNETLIVEKDTNHLVVMVPFNGTSFAGYDDLASDIASKPYAPITATSAVATKVTLTDNPLTLANGVNGTVAERGTQLVSADGGTLYIAVDDCTISESNWKKIALSPISES